MIITILLVSIINIIIQLYIIDYTIIEMYLHLPKKKKYEKKSMKLTRNWDQAQ